jgi:tRNA dimethylallyltransferase
MNPIVVISGPTAVGKTDFAIWLAKRLNGEIISADSIQVYKYMDIGTAKPNQNQQQQVKHHLIDIVEPNQNFSVADYQSLFDPTVNSVISQGKLPVVVGGTGLYIRACLRSFSFQDPGADLELRHRLREQAAEAEEPGLLHHQLKQVDPRAAEKIHPNDTYRIIRALEVYLLTGTPLSLLQTEQKTQNRYQTIYLFLDRDRDELYQRIEMRVNLMLEQGLATEVKRLLEQGFSPELKAMQSLGYQQINDYIQNKISLEQAQELIKQKTRNYAKRQLTWFRREPVDWWVNISGRDQEFFGEILNYIEGRLKHDVE